LGRDFIGQWDIAIQIGRGGWSHGNSRRFNPFDRVQLSVRPPNEISPSTRNLPCKIKSPSPMPQVKVNNEVVGESLTADPPPVEVKTLDTLDTNQEATSESVPFRSPAQVLAAWDNLDDYDTVRPKQEKVPVKPLFEELPDFLSAPTYLSEDEKFQLKDLMTEFKDIFTKKPGLCKLFKHKINTGYHAPITSPVRPKSIGKKKIFDEALDELLELGVVEPANRCPWASPAFTVPKPDGTPRFITAYQQLNNITVPDKYPIPRMDDMLSFLGDFKYISLFDLSKGFYQIEIEEEDEQKTAFVCHRGHYQFNRVPMGLSNSPATFQRTVDAVLSDLRWKCAFGYFDDIGVFSKTFEEHVEHLRLVLTRIRDAGLTMHPKKVQLCRTRLKFLGFIIENGKWKKWKWLSKS